MGHYCSHPVYQFRTGTSYLMSKKLSHSQTCVLTLVTLVNMTCSALLLVTLSGFQTSRMTMVDPPRSRGFSHLSKQITLEPTMSSLTFLMWSLVMNLGAPYLFHAKISDVFELWLGLATMLVPFGSWAVNKLTLYPENVPGIPPQNMWRQVGVYLTWVLWDGQGYCDNSW